jgi:hypothetical protein
MDQEAINYNENATIDDGTCSYAPDEILKIEIIPVFDGQPMELDSAYTTQEGYQIKFSQLNFFLCEIKNGENMLKSAALFDYRETGTLLSETKGSFSDFESLDFQIGVDSARNHGDPSAIENTSVLNISNAGLMHWSWNTGYIFINIEGKVDTLANGIFDHNFSFHIGTDDFLDSNSFNNLIWVQSAPNEHTLQLMLDMSLFIGDPSQPIDLKNEFITHTASNQLLLAQKVATNFKNSLSP